MQRMLLVFLYPSRYAVSHASFCFWTRQPLACLRLLRWLGFPFAQLPWIEQNISFTSLLDCMFLSATHLYFGLYGQKRWSDPCLTTEYVGMVTHELCPNEHVNFRVVRCDIKPIAASIHVASYPIGMRPLI
jgi:hypothetical protein